MIQILFQFILAAFAAMGFCFFFKAPKHLWIKTGIVGAIGWTINYSLRLVVDNPLLVTLLASITVSLLGEILARKEHIPATAVIYPGITPLVPGAGMYYTMYALLQQDYQWFIEAGTETFIVAAGLALGITLALSLSKYIFATKRP